MCACASTPGVPLAFAEHRSAVPACDVCGVVAPEQAKQEPHPEAPLSMADGVPSNCWTCRHNEPDRDGTFACEVDGIDDWVARNCFDLGDPSLMPPRDASGCPGYERAIDRPVIDDGWRSVGKVGGVEVIRNPDREALERIRAALGLGDASADEVVDDLRDTLRHLRLVTEERDEARAEADRLRRELDAERKAHADLHAKARVEAAAYIIERDEARAELASVRERTRRAAQTLIAEVGAGGPMNVDEAAERAGKEIAALRHELAAEREAHAETRRDADCMSEDLSTIADLAGYGHVEPWPGVVEAVRRITDSHAALVVERERVAAFVHDMAFDGALDARDGMARGWDVLERLSDVAQAGADALAAAAAEWGER